MWAICQTLYPRITSYNVCYTKLLRDCSLRLRKVLVFYFGIETCAYIFGRISIVRGDIEQKGLGIEKDIAEKIV